MVKFVSYLILLIALLGAVPAHAKTDLWIMPPPDNNGQNLREMFQSPNQWRQTRSLLTGIGYADHWLNTQFSDAELRAWLPLVRQWNLKLVLEVGAVKPWGRTGDAAFAHDRKIWDRLQNNGGHIDAIAMDEPLAASRQLAMTPEQAVEETAKFIALVRQNYPDIAIGDIEPYPGISREDIMNFEDAVQARLKQMNVRGLDFLRLDVDWMHFVAKDEKGREGWPGVSAIENACHKRGLPFSLIYWAANYPSFKKTGRATSETWETAIIGQGQSYAATGAAPDEYVIESWVGTPDHAVPESAEGTFTRSVLDFCRAVLDGQGQ